MAVTTSLCASLEEEEEEEEDEEEEEEEEEEVMGDASCCRICRSVRMTSDNTRGASSLSFTRM